MKKIACIVFALTHFFLSAQNLVPNGSFENISSCGTQATLAVNWSNPTQAGTPDLYNICAPNRVPSHTIGGGGFQIPKTGVSYVGMFGYSNPIANAREYIQTQLTTALTANALYFVKFYTVLSNFSKYAINNTGMYFSNNNTYQTGGTYLLNYIPQIKLFNNAVITDSLNWIEVSGVYTASGGENFLIIGNFNADLTTDTVSVNYGTYQGAYYYIDDVSVENITTPKWQYRDTTIYLGDSVLIGPGVSGLNVDWFDMSNTFIKNAPGIYVKPIVTTPYQATETFNSVVYNHTVTVTVLLPSKVDEYNKLQKSVTIFPNPNNGNVSLQFAEITKGNVDVTISDVTGKIVYANKLSVTNALTNFDIDVKSGIYFVKIYDSSLNKTLIKKLVVQQ
ncbi:MAG: T9SS type A sorting domain-containing protein [Bacteroidetes bacterium]|nr:T9SS type A sorting domain-containing protein [Bacteroidota bacterium]